jgi:hypothetical protein
LRATCRKALAAQNRPPRLGLERHAVGLTALIASYLEPFTLAASGLTRSTAKVSAPRIAAGFAALGMGKAALPIIVLFSLSKGKARSALGTGYFQIWHGFLRGFFSVKG